MRIEQSSGTMKSYSIAEIVTHREGMRSLVFETDLTIEPGQFVMLWLPGVDEKPFSASNMRDGLLELTICAVGACTEALMTCEVGQYLGIRGPYGRGFTLSDGQLLLGGGMGIAPLRYLARALLRDGFAFQAVFGAATAQDLMFRAEYAQAPWCHLVTEDGSAGVRGLVTDDLEEMISSKSPGMISGCGPPGMLDTIQRVAGRRGLNYQLAFERYMKCGIGICGTCCMEGTGIRVCADGPVLTNSDLESWNSGEKAGDRTLEA